MAGDPFVSDFTDYQTTAVEPGWEFTVVVIVICILINLSLPLWLRAGDWCRFKRNRLDIHEHEITLDENAHQSKNGIVVKKEEGSSVSGSIYSKNLALTPKRRVPLSSAPSSLVPSSVASSSVLTDVASTILEARPRRSRLPHQHRKKRIIANVAPAAEVSSTCSDGQDTTPRAFGRERKRHPAKRDLKLAAELATADHALQRYINGDRYNHPTSDIRSENGAATASVMSKLDPDDISIQDAVDAKDVGNIPPIGNTIQMEKLLPDNETTRWNLLLQIADWDKEMKKLVGLAVPFCLQGVSVELFAIVNVAIVGHFIGIKEANAFVVVGILLEMTSTFNKGCAESVGVLIPHANGAGNDLLVGRYLQLGLIFQIILAIPGVIIWGLFTKEAVMWFGFDEETAIVGQDYAYTLLIYLFLSGISHSFAEFLNTLDHENYATLFTVFAAGFESVAIVVVAVLGVKDLVVVGLVQTIVGLAAVIVDLAIMFCSGWLDPYLDGLLRTNGLKDRRAIHTVLITAIPLGINWMLTFGEWEIMTLFAVNMGAAEVAAWGIIGYLWSMFETITDGIGDAAEVRVGFRMGAGQYGIAKYVGGKSIYVGVVVAIFETGILFIFAQYLPGWLTPDPLLQKLLFDMLPLIGFAQILMVAGMEAWAVVGAQGRVRLATLVEFVVSWFVAVPLSAVCVFVFNLNLESMVASLTIAYTVGANVYLYMLITSDWEGLSAVVVARNKAEGVMYDEFDWDDLPEDIQQAASTLGYTQELWDNDREPETAEKSWHRLTENEKRAATVLGFTQTKWDSDDSSTEESSDDKYQNYAWKKLPREVKKAARILGYTQKLWDNDKDSPLEAKKWDELTLAQQAAAQMIGYDQRRWDKVPVSYDHLDWDSLPENVKEAATYLQYSKRSWNYDEGSPLQKKTWDDLTEKQQQAAITLGFYKEKWGDGSVMNGEYCNDSDEGFETVEKQVTLLKLSGNPSKTTDEEHSLAHMESSLAYIAGSRDVASLFFFGSIANQESISVEKSTIEVCGYDEDECFRNLPVKVQVAARELGYNEDMWDKGTRPSSRDKSWDALTSREQRAAQVLGYNGQSWNVDDS